MTEAEALNGLLVLSFGVIGVIFLSFVVYVMVSLGLYKMAKRFGMVDEAVFAFIPGFGFYLLGRFVDDDAKGLLRGKLGYLIGGSLIASLVFPIFLFVSYVTFVYALFLLFKKLGMFAVLHTIVHVVTLFTLTPVLFLWVGYSKKIAITRDNDSGIRG